MKEIPLTQGYVTIVDDDDYERVADLKWRALVKSRADGSVLVYAIRNIARSCGGRTTQRLHRFIMDTPDGMETDHINGNGLDNRSANLRVCSHAENQRNRQPRTGGTSAAKGVYWIKRDAKWVAQIKFEGKRKHLGYFASELDAANAYDAAALKYFGEFARVNTYEAQDE